MAIVPYYIIPQYQRRTLDAALLALNQGAEDQLPFPNPLLLQAVIIPGERLPEGQAIAAVTPAWLEILHQLRGQPDLIYSLDWRKWEEIIAGAYRAEGFEVILTPRSNDKGRDIIATRTDVGQVRFFDQVKAYTPGHVVALDDVHAMLGVLTLEPNVSKGIITTTTTFAPGVFSDSSVAKFLPYRLELRDRVALLEWFGKLVDKDNRV